MAKTSPIAPPRTNPTPFGTLSTQRQKETRVRTSRYEQSGEEPKAKFPDNKVEEMASDPKVPEVMKWRQDKGEDGNEGGDDLSRTSAPSVVTTVTHMARAQELVKVHDQLTSGVQIVGRELARIDHQVQLLDLEYQTVQESFAA